ncbi:assimilatory sulfite reductase (NADPH) hemoprotein subunit [Celerinatantimonas sp. YJH-8]|uniref:assimilatory sulfite reductase (NADPH) hemoprotein subunit n=1 Tax=Celerinatantimonas sp. YJH-8 TaxID=3228714 RepID=UPI0038C359AD
MSDKKLAVNEYIKARSNFLRGTIEEGINDPLTGAISEDDTQLTKFHGFYQQDDRDLRNERKSEKLEPLYSFMLRARVPGGVCTAEQWLMIDEIAQHLTRGNIRLTTRQTFQYHGILKRNLKTVIQKLHQRLLDSIAACGDVNRNVMCNPNPVESKAHEKVYQFAVELSEHFMPHSRAYAEIFLDEKPLNQPEEEPLYGPTYLPRKFKIGLAVPPHNDVDVYTNDLGLIAILDGEELLGFDVAAGGGMGTTHGDTNTYPRLGDTLGFVRPEDVLKVSEAIFTTQRDFGDRENRKHARLKYTIDTMGLDVFKAEVEKRSGVTFAPAHQVTWTTRGDRFGWIQGFDGRWHLTCYIPNGRIADTEHAQLMTGLREIAKVHQGDIRMTANQNIIIAGVPEAEKAQIEQMARQYGLYGEELTWLRKLSIACVALPTCGLAMAESERYIPELITKVDALLEKNGLANEPIVMRMTGCPNGCARPFAAEIGFVGKGPGRYNLYLGASPVGTRLNKLYRENIPEETILEELDGLFARFAKERQEQEGFGDYVVRAGIVKAVNQGREFHD